MDSKDDLVLKMIERHLEEEKKRSAALHAAAGNAIEEIFMVMKNSSADFQKIKSNILFEMQRFHREAWEKLQNYQQKEMYQVVYQNLLRGIHEGFYRGDLNADIIARLHIAGAFQVFDETIFPYPQYSREELFKEYMLHYLYGVISEKGRKVFEVQRE